MLENGYQSRLIKKLRRMFPGCIVLKNDSGYRQGIPDLIVLYEDRWAMLEVKRSANDPMRPNQEYYVGLLDSMSFAAFIHPQNEREVLRALQQAFRSRREARVPQR